MRLRPSIPIFFLIISIICLQIPSTDAPPIIAEATDSNGQTRNDFLTTENVYATGSGYPSGLRVDIYVVKDRAWTGGESIPADISSDWINIVTTDGSGNLGPVLIWASPLPVGRYDVVFDSNPYKTYNPPRDVVDHPNHPGFTVSSLDPGSVAVGGFYIPINNLAVLLPYLVLVCLLGAVTTVLVKRKRFRN